MTPPRYGLSSTNCVVHDATQPEGVLIQRFIRSLAPTRPAGAGVEQLQPISGHPIAAAGSAAPGSGHAEASLGSPADKVGADGGGGEDRLAPIPAAAPPLPQAALLGQVFEMMTSAVLSPLPDPTPGTTVARRCTVVGNGMGGAGKTTLAAAVLRLPEVRRRFDRVAFVAVGQTPELTLLQRQVGRVTGSRW